MKQVIFGVRLAAAIIAAGILHVQAQVTTVWYQPTSYPIKKIDGSPMPEDIGIVHIWDGWLNNYYPAIKTYQDNSDEIKIGGYGDIYTTLIKFDLTGLPQQVSGSYLYLYSLPRGASLPSKVALFMATSDWNTSVQWGNTSLANVFEPYSSVLPSTLPV